MIDESFIVNLNIKHNLKLVRFTYKIKYFFNKFLCLFGHNPGLWGTNVIFKDNGCVMYQECPRCNKVLKTQEINDSRLFGTKEILVWNEGMIKEYGVTKEYFNQLQEKGKE